MKFIVAAITLILFQVFPSFMNDPDLRRKFARIFVSGDDFENEDPLKRTNPFSPSCLELDKFLVKRVFFLKFTSFGVPFPLS